MKYGIVAAVFAIIAMVLLSVAMTMPWYEIRWTAESDEPILEISKMEIKFEFYLNEAEARGEVGKIAYEETIEYDDAEDDDNGTAPITVFRNTQNITIVAIIFSLILAVCSLVVGFKKGMLANLALVVGLMAFVATLLAPMYLMVELPNALEEDAEEEGYFLGDEEAGATESFFGSETEEEEGGELKSTWGGVTGWYLAVGAMVFNFMALFFIIIARSAAKRKREPGAELEMGFEEEPEIKTMVLLDAQEVEKVPEPEGQIVECPKCNYLLRVRTPERPVTIRCPNCKVIGDLK